MVVRQKQFIGDLVEIMYEINAYANDSLEFYTQTKNIEFQEEIEHKYKFQGIKHILRL